MGSIKEMGGMVATRGYDRNQSWRDKGDSRNVRPVRYYKGVGYRITARDEVRLEQHHTLARLFKAMTGGENGAMARRWRKSHRMRSYR